MNLAASARRILGAAAVAAGTLAASQALAQPWPAKPIRMIVNFPAGGAVDVIGRAVAPGLAEALGQQIVIENRPGAGGNIGADAVAKSPGDGYTLLMSSGGTISINPSLYPKMPFDATRDLQPVAAAARVLVFLVARPELAPKNIAEFIAYLRANPGRLSYGSPGNGSSPHLAGEMFKSAAKVFATHIPYRGAAPALTDLLGGQLDYMFDPGIGLAHVRSGKLRLLAIGSPKRSPLFPDVPTMGEAGFPGVEVLNWQGIIGPKGLPAEIVKVLNAAGNKALQDPALRETMASQGNEIAGGTPEQFAALIKSEAPRWGKVVKDAKIEPE